MKPFKYVELLLRYRLRSENEIRERMSRRGYQKEEIEEVVNKLKSSGLIDDLNFARFWINYRLSNNPRSRFYIESELKKKGVSKENIIEAFQGVENLDDKKTAYKLASKKYKTLMRIKDPLVRKRRLYAYLERRGFNYETIKEVFQKLSEEG